MLAQEIKTEAGRLIIQTCLDHLWTLAEKWGMKFNIQKCHILHLGRNNLLFEYTLGEDKVACVEEEKDIGVLITSSLKPGRKCEQAAGVANRILSQVLRAFTFSGKEVLPKIFKS